MPDPAQDSRRLDRRFDSLEYSQQRSAAVHGLYAAIVLLVGLFLPLAELTYNGDPPDRYTPFGLIFSIAGEYELDHPTWVLIAALLVVGTTLTAVLAFLIAARRQDRTAALVALTASAALLPVLLLANFVFGVTDADTGSDDDPLAAWTVGFWVLVLGALAGCWIASFLREQLER